MGGIIHFDPSALSSYPLPSWRKIELNDYRMALVRNRDTVIDPEFNCLDSLLAQSELEGHFDKEVNSLKSF